MAKAQRIDIISRLETTKRHGLVEDYRVDWQGRAFRPPHVTVTGRTSVPPQVTKNYLSELLEPFVASHRIEVRNIEAANQVAGSGQAQPS